MYQSQRTLSHAQAEDSLAHYGIPGMRWGKRKAAYDAGGSTGKERHAAAAQAALDKSGGSKGKAVAKIAGKHIVEGTLINAGTMLAGAALKNHPVAKAGVQAASSVLGLAVTVSNIRDTAAVIKSDGKKQGRTGPK